MKKSIFTFFFILTSFNTFSHEYYFAFSEMEYNIEHKNFELTLFVSTHDIEHWFQDNNIQINELEDHVKDTTLQKQFGTILLNGFSVTNNDSKLQFKIVGYEVLKTGISQFYFVSNNVEIVSPLLIKFDLLMNKYPEQQNKLTFIFENQKKSYSFLPSRKEETIEF
jgi:hypothetical protein